LDQRYAINWIVFIWNRFDRCVYWIEPNEFSDYCNDYSYPIYWWLYWPEQDVYDYDITPPNEPVFASKYGSPL
jgi:hypothetical protein